jgi:lipopolysaccharide biosynthesis protein
MTSPLARVLAFYLPQFHPTPENDLWWGPGFTEWTNVAKAKPLYPGHVQPRLPADLGFYDLRVPEVRERQAELARAAGVESFCYWHYWFGDGRRILERPFEEVVASGAPDFPFCLAWANQTWTGIWHGAAGRTLIEQTYPGAADREAHFRWAQRAFEDPRYSRVDGKPIFVVFSPSHLPSTVDFVDHWRELAHKAGYPGLYFVGVSDAYDQHTDRYRLPMLEPFDAVTLLGPQDYIATRGAREKWGLKRRLKERNLGRFNRFRPKSWAYPTRIDFADVVEHAFEDMPEGERFLPAVLSGWDNTPRSSERGVVYENSTPELFERYMAKAVERLRDHPKDKRIVFVKAWNEWAEGNIIEPDAVHGHGFLDAIRKAVASDGARAEAISRSSPRR